MSRTTRGSKGCGYDYWSRRHPGNGITGYGKSVKKMTHKYERQQGKEECEQHTEVLRMPNVSSRTQQ